MQDPQPPSTFQAADREVSRRIMGTVKRDSLVVEQRQVCCRCRVRSGNQKMFARNLRALGADTCVRLNCQTLSIAEMHDPMIMHLFIYTNWRTT
jgi:hypothetical protein